MNTGESMFVSPLNIKVGHTVKALVLDPSEKSFFFEDVSMDLHTIQGILDCECMSVFPLEIEGERFQVICNEYGLQSDYKNCPSIITDANRVLIVGPIIVLDENMDGLNGDMVEKLRDHIRIVRTVLQSQSGLVSRKNSYCLTGVSKTN